MNRNETRKLSQLARSRAWVGRLRSGQGGLGSDGNALYASLPITLRAVATGCLAAFVFYFAVNGVCLARVRSAFHSQVPAELIGKASTAEAVTALIESGRADPSLRSWLLSFVTPDMRSKDLLTQGLNAITASTASQAGGDGEGDLDAQVAVELQRLASGDPRRGWILPLIATRNVGADEIPNRLLTLGDHWREGIEKEPNQAAYREFLRFAASDLTAATRAELRHLRRFNGLCQFVTIALAFTLLVLVVQRWQRIRRWSAVTVIDWADERIPQDVRRMPRMLSLGPIREDSIAQRTMLFQEEMVQLQQQVESEVYDPLGTLTACLPSLGFIGTVIGMGGALLKADRLFDSQERALAIGEMTEQLGFAFDTTLISLACSLAVGLAIAWLRRRDSALRQNWFDVIETAQLHSPSEGLSDVAA